LTPNPTFEGPGAILDLTIFLVSFLFVCSLQSNEGQYDDDLLSKKSKI